MNLIFFNFGASSVSLPMARSSSRWMLLSIGRFSFKLIFRLIFGLDSKRVAQKTNSEKIEFLQLVKRRQCKYEHSSVFYVQITEAEMIDWPNVLKNDSNLVVGMKFWANAPLIHHFLIKSFYRWIHSDSSNRTEFSVWSCWPSSTICPRRSSIWSGPVDKSRWGSSRTAKWADRPSSPLTFVRFS